MEKLTLSIRDKKKIEWAKGFASRYETSLSKLFENYLDALQSFDQLDVQLDSQLESLRQPGQRPTQKDIDRHLAGRRRRKAVK